MLRAPRVRIEVYGEGRARDIYHAFTARHRRFQFTAAKRWGVALLRLPTSFDDYLAGPPRKAVRQNRRRAEAAGFRYAIVDPHDHLDEIVEINRSAPVRQGRAMPGVDMSWASREIGAWPTIHGILNADGHLRAYATALNMGEAFVFSSLIGHADDLQHGIMYLLVSEVVRACIAARGPDGRPSWLMADTFWGATEGLAYFKQRVGLEPFTVEWVWLDRPCPEAPSR